MHKIQAVTRVFKKVDTQVASFKEKSQLSCVANCGLCCANPNIQATILEFIPAAYSLFMSGEYLDVVDRIDAGADNTCIFFNPFNPGNNCSNYQNRGLICRMFGFTAKTNKEGQKVLVSCKPIKESYNPAAVQKHLHLAPEMAAYYMSLYGIDPKLSVEYYPINQAIKKAIEIVILHFQYRKKPA